MGNIFQGSEIVELGIQIEKNGKDFYNALIAKSKSPKSASVFKFLSGEEEKHILVFTGLLRKLDKYEPAGLDAEEYSAYMNALASECIFTQKGKGEQTAQSVNSDKEAVELGIGFEKDSIVFYEGMKRLVPEYDQEIVEQVIAQEQMHLKQLTDLKAVV